MITSFINSLILFESTVLLFYIHHFVFVRKYQHRRHRRPIEDRLEEFYTKIDDTLAQEEEEELKATDKETVKRKWALITKGVQAALMIGGDNEDGEDGED